MSDRQRAQTDSGMNLCLANKSHRFDRSITLQAGARKSGVDVVKGSRFLPGGYSKDISFVRRTGNRILLSIVNLIWSTNYTDLCYGFMGFNRNGLKEISPYLSSQNFEIETEICIKAKKKGLKVLEIPSVEYARRYGKSNLKTFWDGFLIFKEILRELFEI